MANINLCSFVDSRMSPTLKRLKKQAEAFDIFEKILLYNEKCFDEDFLKIFGSKLNPKTRGYGYWVWKPYIIQKALSEINEDDILLYIDAGSHLNINGKERFKEYLEIVNNNKSGFLTFEIYGEVFLEKYWTKGDLLNFFGVIDNNSITDSPMRDATTIFIRKSQYSLAFIDRWLSVFKSNYSLIDDTPSVIPNFEGFIEHRFDQSVYSILCKIEGLEVLSAKEIYNTDWKLMDNCPIWQKRDKYIKLRYRYSLQRFLKKIKKRYFTR